MAISPIVTQIYNDLSYKEEDVDKEVNVILLELYLWDENQKNIQITNNTDSIYPNIYSLLDFNIYFENYRIMYNYLVMALDQLDADPRMHTGGTTDQVQSRKFKGMKKGVDGDDARRLREKITNQIRKSKRDEQLKLRRTDDGIRLEAAKLFGNTPANVSTVPTHYENISVRFNGKGILLALMLYLLKIPIDVNKDKLPIKHEVMTYIKAQIMVNTLNIFNIIDMQLQEITGRTLTRAALKSSGFEWCINTIVSKKEDIEIDKFKHTLFSVYAKSNGSYKLMEKYINEFFPPPSQTMQDGGAFKPNITVEIFKSFFEILGGALDVNCYKNDSAHDDMTKGPANEDQSFIKGIEDKLGQGKWEQVMLSAGSFYLIDRQTGIIDITDNDEYVIPQELPEWNYVIDAGGWQRAFPIFKNVCDTIGTTKNISNLTDPASTGKGNFYICYEELGEGETSAEKANTGAGIFIQLLISFMKSIIEKQSDPELDIVKDDYISHIWNFLNSLAVTDVDDLGNIKVRDGSMNTYIWDGKQPLMATYIDGFASNLPNATTTNSGATPRSSTSDSSNNLVEGFKAFLNQKIQIDEIDQRYYILLITFCRILKFAGDCSHIVCAILLIFIKESPKPHIILTLDRLLGKNVILAIEHCRKVANNGLTDDDQMSSTPSAAAADTDMMEPAAAAAAAADTDMMEPAAGDDTDTMEDDDQMSSTGAAAADTDMTIDEDDKIETIKQIAEHVGNKLGVSLACNCQVHSLLKELPTYLQLQKFQPDEDRYGEIFVYKYPEDPQVVICNKYIEAHKKIAQAEATKGLYPNLDQELSEKYTSLSTDDRKAEDFKQTAVNYLNDDKIDKLPDDFPKSSAEYPLKVQNAMEIVNNIEKKRMEVKEIMIIQREKDFFDYKYPPPCPTPPCPRPRRNSAQRPPTRVHNLLNIYPFNMKMGKGKILGNININSSYDDTLKKVFGILFKYHQNLKSENLLGVYREGTPGETFEERIQEMCKQIIENWLNGDREEPDINKVADEIIDALPKPVIEHEEDNIQKKINSNINSYHTDVVSILREAQKINKLISARAAAAAAASSTVAAFGGKRRKTTRKRKKKRKITRRRRYISKKLSRQHKRIKRKFKIHLTRKLKK